MGFPRLPVHPPRPSRPLALLQLVLGLRQGKPVAVVAAMSTLLQPLGKAGTWLNTCGPELPGRSCRLVPCQVRVEVNREGGKTDVAT